MIRSRVHMLNVAAARLEAESGNPKLIADLREAAKADAKGKAEGRGWTSEDITRVERQRTLFTMLPVSASVDRLKEAMMQRVYDLMWDGNTEGADALQRIFAERRRGCRHGRLARRLYRARRCAAIQMVRGRSMTRTRAVTFRSPETQPSARLRDLSPTYRVATEALVIAADLGCSGDLYDALWSLCQREADAYHATLREGQAA